MSRLCLPNGDDHPEAARKHLLDAQALLAGQRADGAAYLSGYVVECALKSVHILQTGQPLQGHKFARLLPTVSALTAVAGARAARYLGPVTAAVLASPVAQWDPEMRYRAPTFTLADAQLWHDRARDVFQETVHKMSLDGEL